MFGSEECGVSQKEDTEMAKAENQLGDGRCNSAGMLDRWTCGPLDSTAFVWAKEVSSKG